MIVQCDKCQTRFRVPDDRVPPEGTHVRCSKCHNTFWFTPAKSAAGVEISIPDRPQYSAPPPPNETKDSWFDLPDGPGDDGEGLDIDMGPSEPLATEKHDLQFRDSWWGTNSLDQLLQEEGLSLDELARRSGGDEPPPLSIGDSKPSPILGDVMEDLSTASHFDPSYPELVSKRPQDIRLEVPQNASSDIIPTAPSEPILTIDEPPTLDGAALASVKQPAEFLLLDHAKQREDMWYTVAPLLMRGALLFLLLLAFVGLWAVLDNKHSNAASPFSWSNIKQTFIGTSTPWKLSQVKLQQMPLREKYLLLISGKLTNGDDKAKSAPNINVSMLPKQGSIPSLPCCRKLTPKQLSIYRSDANVRAFYRKLNRPTLKPDESKPFSLLLLVKKPLHSVELTFAPTGPTQGLGKARRKRRKRPAPRRKADAPAKRARKKTRNKKTRRRKRTRRRRRSKRRKPPARRPTKRR